MEVNRHYCPNQTLSLTSADVFTESSQKALLVRIAPEASAAL